MNLRHLFTAASLTVASLALPALADQWPAWRGPNADGIVKEVKAIQPWPASGPKRLWSAKVGVGFATPVVADGKLYSFMLNDDGKGDTLFAFDPASGKLLWKQTYTSTWTGTVPGAMTGGWKGTRATPVIENGRVYTLGSRGDFHCHDAANGKLLWQTNVLTDAGAKSPIEWGCASNPLILGDMIIIQGGREGALAVAYNKNTGKPIWMSASALAGYAQPLLVDVQGTQQLIIFGGDAIHALNPKTGKSIWSHPFKTQYDVNAATPLYRDGKLLIGANYGHGGMLYQLSPTSAKPLWPSDNKNLKWHFQPPILDGDVFYGNSEGKLHCLTWPDAQVKWSASENITNGGSLLRVGSQLLILTQNGKLILAEATPAALTKQAEVKAFDEGRQIWSSPMLHNGKLYLKGTDELICLEVAAQ